MESAIIMLIVGLVVMYSAKYAQEPAQGVINVVGIILAVYARSSKKEGYRNNKSTNKFTPCRK